MPILSTLWDCGSFCEEPSLRARRPGRRVAASRPIAEVIRDHSPTCSWGMRARSVALLCPSILIFPVSG